MSCGIFYCRTISDKVTRHQIDLKGGNFAVAKSQALFCLGSLSGFQSGSWWHGTECLMFASSGWFIGSLTLLFSFSTGGWVALRWVHQGSLLQSWKIWGEFKWCLSIWNVTLFYCFISHFVEKNKFQCCYCKEKKHFVVTWMITALQVTEPIGFFIFK